MKNKKRQELIKRKKDLQRELSKINKELRNRVPLSKKEALDRIYKISPTWSTGRGQGQLKLPQALIGLKVKLKEEKVTKTIR